MADINHNDDDDDDEYDEELKQAIALSLQDQQASEDKSQLASELVGQEKENPKSRVMNKKWTEVIDLEHVDSHESTEEEKSKRTSSDNSSTEKAQLQSFLGLNRKVMEQERLERLSRKRKASISPPPVRKNIKVSNDTDSPSCSKPFSIDIHQMQMSSAPKAISQTSTKSNPSVDPLFLNGVVKKTSALGHDRHDDIKIEEVLQSNDLTLAILSSFQWDVEWLLRKLNTRTTQMIFVMQAKDESTKRKYQHEISTTPNLRLCFPSMEGQINCMHSKLMLLSHPTHLRIVVPTANLVPYDWGETGVMENMVFLIDLPRLPDTKSTPPKPLTTFGKDLVYFLEAQGLESSIIQSLSKFDFSRTTDLAFVHTIGGTHRGPDEPWRHTGVSGLGRAIKSLDLAHDKPLQINFVTSSLGALTLDFLATLYLAARGDDGLTEFNLRQSLVARKKAQKHEAARHLAHTQIEAIRAQVATGMRIYFPSHDTVAASTGGVHSGGTICFQRKWYTAPTFPRAILRDCRSCRKGLLMHNKVLLPFPPVFHPISTPFCFSPQ